MATLRKKSVRNSTAPVATAAVALRPVSDDHEPIASPAHDLQRTLHDAGYRSEPFRPRPMSNAMLFLTVVCVYALSMLMIGVRLV